MASQIPVSHYWMRSLSLYHRVMSLSAYCYSLVHSLFCRILLHRTTVQHTLGCTGGCTQGLGPGAIAQRRRGVSLGCARSRAQHRLGLLPRCTALVRGWKSDQGTGWGGGCWRGYGRLARATGALLSAAPALGLWESLCALSKSSVSFLHSSRSSDCKPGWFSNPVKGSHLSSTGP